jgi:hypothetical protein
LTISIQSLPGSPLAPFVLDGNFTAAPFFCAGCCVTAIFASSFGATTAPSWALRLAKGLTSICTGLAAGLTGFYLFFKIWPMSEGMHTWDFFFMVLFSYWMTVIPISCLAGLVCAFWNSGEPLSWRWLRKLSGRSGDMNA